jgi:hypothetical protein
MGLGKKERGTEVKTCKILFFFPGEGSSVVLLLLVLLEEELFPQLQTRSLVHKVLQR